MKADHTFLAQKDGTGAVYRCPHGCIHIQIGRTSIALTEDEYFDVVDLIHSSAASYEVGRHEDLGGDAGV